MGRRLIEPILEDQGIPKTGIIRLDERGRNPLRGSLPGFRRV
ncbi:MAG: hypothetical protein ACUVTM_04415 [Candidatus Bathyarchaeia archaeon]